MLSNWYMQFTSKPAISNKWSEILCLMKQQIGPMSSVVQSQNITLQYGETKTHLCCQVIDFLLKIRENLGLF